MLKYVGVRPQKATLPDHLPSRNVPATKPSIVPKRLLLLTLFLLSLPAILPAQTRYHELGLRSGGFDNFSFLYKRSTDQRKFFRVRLIALNSRLSLTDTNTSDYVSAGVALGRERRRDVAENFYFVHGPEVSAFGNKSRVTDREDWNANIRLGYLLGFNYSVSDRFIVGIETIPGLQYQFGENYLDQRESSLGLDFSTNAVAVTALFRFTGSDE